jgi:hypothetical protein
MKIQPTRAKTKSRASVIVIILVFLGLMALIVVSNNLALERLDKNLRLIEQKQVRKAGAAATSTSRSNKGGI